MDYIRFWVSCFLRSFKVSFRVSDWLDFVVPIVFAAIGSVLGYEFVSTLPNWALVLLLFSTLFFGRLFLVAPYQIWREQAEAASKANARIIHFQRAWDRSGRHLISMREALEMVAAHLSDQWPINLSKAEKLEKAARKIRELGLEGQIKISGVEQLAEPDIFREIQIEIPPSYWLKAEIIVESVYSGESTPDTPVAHTEEDQPIGDISVEEVPIYGDLRINRYALMAACPPVGA